MRLFLFLPALLLSVLFGARGVVAQDPLGGFDPADFGKIVIHPRQSASGAGGISLEQAFGNYQNEPVIAYGESSQAVRLGRPIGRLDMLFEDGSTGFCTAFIVDDDHLLTNHHCVPGLPRDGVLTAVKSVQFVAGYIRPGHGEGVDRYTVAPAVVETDRALDYSVLTVFGRPSEKYGVLELAAADPEDGEFLWIIGHPQGQSQHISREGCAASSPAISGEGKLMHTCDTLGGNSGSPVLRLSDKRAVALHHAGDSRTGYNMAIPMARILAASQVLTSADGAPLDAVSGAMAQSGQVAAVPPGSEAGNSCGALWTEAKVMGCAGYQSYLETCGGHVFSGMARRLVAQECTAPETAQQADIVVNPAGGDFTDLSEAVRLAPDGARIVVWPGVYSGAIEGTRDMHIVGEGAHGRIVIDGPLRWTAGRGSVTGLVLRGGVTVAGGTLTLEDNELSAQGTAVDVLGRAEAVLLRNLIRQSAIGVSVTEGGRATLEDNEFSDVGQGLYVADAAPQARDNRFVAGMVGLRVVAGGAGLFEDNSFDRQGQAAVDLVGASGPVLRGNIIRDAVQVGIMVRDGAQARIEGNRVTASGWAGIEIRANATPEIIDNEIADGAQSGVYIHSGGGGIVQGNDLHHNAFHAMSARGDVRPVVRGNVMHANGYDAVRLREGAAGTWEDNDLSGNRAGAFRVEPDAGPVLRRGNRE